MFCCIWPSPKCLVFLFNLYMKKLPKYAFDNDILYLPPKATAPSDPEAPWYDEVPVGKNTLAAMVKEMCMEAGFNNKTNHSLCATGTSAMFRANVPEKIIQKTTGHRSIEALRSYERISEEQHRAVSKVMMTNTEYEGAHSGLCTEIQCQEDRLVQYNAGTTESLGRLFGDLTNCTIGSLTVNVRPIYNVQSAEKVDKEFDELVQHADFDYWLLYGVHLFPS